MGAADFAAFSTAIFASAAASTSATRYDDVSAQPEPVPSGVRAVHEKSTDVASCVTHSPALVASARLHDVQWTWVRGHRGHPKNEYANDLAVLAAREQRTSEGIVDSGFDQWLEEQRRKGRYLEYDPDADFVSLAARIESGEAFPLAEGA